MLDTQDNPASDDSSAADQSCDNQVTAPRVTRECSRRRLLKRLGDSTSNVLDFSNMAGGGDDADSYSAIDHEHSVQRVKPSRPPLLRSSPTFFGRKKTLVKTTSFLDKDVEPVEKKIDRPPTLKKAQSQRIGASATPAPLLNMQSRRGSMTGAPVSRGVNRNRSYNVNTLPGMNETKLNPLNTNKEETLEEKILRKNAEFARPQTSATQNRRPTTPCTNEQVQPRGLQSVVEQDEANSPRVDRNKVDRQLLENRNKSFCDFDASEPRQDRRPTQRNQPGIDCVNDAEQFRGESSEYDKRPQRGDLRGYDRDRDIGMRDRDIGMRREEVSRGQDSTHRLQQNEFQVNQREFDLRPPRQDLRGYERRPQQDGPNSNVRDYDRTVSRDESTRCDRRPARDEPRGNDRDHDRRPPRADQRRYDATPQRDEARGSRDYDRRPLREDPCAFDREYEINPPRSDAYNYGSRSPRDELPRRSDRDYERGPQRDGYNRDYDRKVREDQRGYDRRPPCDEFKRPDRAYDRNPPHENTFGQERGYCARIETREERNRRERSNMRYNRPLIEIVPGYEIPLIGAEETAEAFRNGQILEVTCTDCRSFLYCILGASMVLCPCCRSMSPVEQKGVSVLCQSSETSQTVGLGLTVSNATGAMYQR